MPKNDKVELGIPTKAGYVGVKIPSKVAILGMKISTKVFLLSLALGIGAMVVLWWYLTYQSGFERNQPAGSSQKPRYL